MLFSELSSSIFRVDVVNTTMSAASILSLPILDEAPQIAYKEPTETFLPTAPITPSSKDTDEKLRDNQEQSLELDKPTMKDTDGQVEKTIMGQRSDIQGTVENSAELSRKPILKDEEV